MSISIFSMIMAILWFDAFILLGSVLRRKTGFLLHYSLWPMMALIVISLTRVMLPFELPFATVMHSYQLMPALQKIWNYQVLLWGGIQTKIAWIIVCICTAVSVILLIHLFVKIHQGSTQIKALYTEEDPRAKLILQEIIEETKLGEECTLCIAPDIASPIVTGLFHPVIIIPENMRLLSEKQLRYILRHEWCHYLSKDLWVKLLIHVLCCVMWWNPPVYLLKKDLDQILELYCDRRVTKGIRQKERLEYLETMIEILNQYYGKENCILKKVVGVNFVGFAKGESTIQRFQLVYDHQKSIANRKSNLFFVFIMGFLFLISFSFVFQPYTLPPEDEVEGCIQITPENSYLKLENDGTYLLYVDGQYLDAILPCDLQTEPFSQLPVK